MSRQKTIGITFSVPENTYSLYSNGIRQNVLYLNEVLNTLEYDVYLICDKPMIKDLPTFDYEKYKTVLVNSPEFKEIKWDIYIQMGLSIPLPEVQALKSTGCKIIFYKCGNDYMIEMEQVLFGTSAPYYPQYADIKDSSLVDEVWMIPQSENTNYHYWQTRYRCPIRIIPFIWSPRLLEHICSTIPHQGLFRDRGANKKIAIFEPNLNMVKYSLPAVMVCEAGYRRLEDKSQLEKVFVTNANAHHSYGNFSVLQFSRMTYNLDLYIDKKLSVEARYNSVFFMNDYSDIAVSHQWENPLNYLYLDLAWMGWPILHNAELCKDIGYYYEGFQFEEGGKMLQYIIQTHHKVAEEYKLKNRELMKRYLPSNPEILAGYRLLIDNL